MRRLPLIPSLAVVASLLAGGCASTRSEPASAAAVAAPVPSQLPRHVRPLRYSLSVIPDAANLRFTGQAAIEIQVLEETDRITVNAADLEIRQVGLVGYMADGRIAPVGSVTNDIAIDAPNQTATVRFSTLRPGRYRLTFD